MQFCIHTQGINLNEAIKRHTYQKLDLALDRLEDIITRVNVYLVDINGPLLGGLDKSCRIVVQLHQQEPLVVESLEEEVDVAIDRTTDRLGVAACQRADALRRGRRANRMWLDMDELPSSNRSH